MLKVELHKNLKPWKDEKKKPAQKTCQPEVHMHHQVYKTSTEAKQNMDILSLEFEKGTIPSFDFLVKGRMKEICGKNLQC